MSVKHFYTVFLTIILFLFSFNLCYASVFDFVSDQKDVFYPDYSSVVKIEVYEDDNKNSKITGSGFYIDYKGRILAAAHIFYKTSDNILDNIYVYQTNDIGHKPNPVKAQYYIENYDIEHDVAVLRKKEDDGEFHSFFKLSPTNQLKNIELNDTGTLVGYPTIGGDTISITQGKVIGFWENPNLKKFLAAGYFDEENMHLIKLDAITGPGASGGPVLFNNGLVSGLIFAASISPGGISYVLTTETINESLNKFKQKQRKKLGIKNKCIYQSDEFLYKMNNNYYYDYLCNHKRSLNTEELLKMNFEARCLGKLDKIYLYNAADYIVSGQSSHDLWWVYLQKICPIKDKFSMRDIILSGNRNKTFKINDNVVNYNESKSNGLKDLDLKNKYFRTFEQSKSFENYFFKPVKSLLKNILTVLGR
jgi:V8-like Glu-specific endopeptidase